MARRRPASAPAPSPPPPRRPCKRSSASPRSSKSVDNHRKSPHLMGAPVDKHRHGGGSQMSANTTSTGSFHVCVPKTSEHRRGMKWFSSLTRAVEELVSTEKKAEPVGEDPVSLQHSIQLYSVYVETGDSRYLQ